MYVPFGLAEVVPPPNPGRAIPESYTPGQPFVLTVDANGLQFKNPDGSTVAGTSYIPNPRANDDLAGYLVNATLQPGVAYYALIATDGGTLRPNFSLADEGVPGDRVSRDPVPLRYATANAAGFTPIMRGETTLRQFEYPSPGFGDAQLVQTLKEGNARVVVKAGAEYRGQGLQIASNTALVAEPGGERPRFIFQPRVSDSNGNITVDGFGVRQSVLPGVTDRRIYNIHLEGLDIRSSGRDDGGANGNAILFFADRNITVRPLLRHSSGPLQGKIVWGPERLNDADLATDVGGNFIVRDCNIRDFHTGIQIGGREENYDNATGGGLLNEHPRVPVGMFTGVLIENVVLIDSSAGLRKDGSGNDVGHSNGLLVGATRGLMVKDCWFDHNGWKPIPNNHGTIFNHNAYINYTCTEAHIENCGFSRASSHAIQMRSGGNFIDNFVDDCPMGVAMYDRPSLYRDSVVMRSGSIPNPKGEALPRGMGLETKIVERLRVLDSLFLRKQSDPQNVNGAFIASSDNLDSTTRQIGTDLSRPARDKSKNASQTNDPGRPSNVVLQDNTIHDWLTNNASDGWWRADTPDHNVDPDRNRVLAAEEIPDLRFIEDFVPGPFADAIEAAGAEASAVASARGATTKDQAYAVFRQFLLTRDRNVAPEIATARRLNEFIKAGLPG